MDAAGARLSALLRRADETELPWLWAVTAAFGAGYGLVMGGYAAGSPERLVQPLYSALKTPLLLLVTYALCVPAFFTLNSLAGLRTDFRRAILAFTAMQACLATALASLAPVTALAYACGVGYQGAVFFNGLMFAAASAVSQLVVRRYYAPLIAADPRHRRMLAVWYALYVFVGIQGAWVLRPFIGNPDAPPALLRPGAWGNAYVAVINLTRGVARR